MPYILPYFRLGAIFLIFLSPPTLASVDVYLGLQVGSQLMRESLSGETYNHQSSFFIGHWGYGLGARAKLELGNIGLGVIGEAGWIGNIFERKQSGSSSSSTYRDGFNRTLGGAHVSINTGPSSIFFEYYPWVQNTVNYAEEKSANPYRKNDTLKATGFGAGFVFGFNNGLASQLLYRKIQYRNVTMNSVAVTLPNDQYTTPTLDEVTMGFVLKF